MNSPNVRTITEEMGHSLLPLSRWAAARSGRAPHRKATVRLKRGLHAWRTWKQPPIVTHDLWDDGRCRALPTASCQLFNARHDAVKAGVPSGLCLGNEPPARFGLRPVCARLPHGRLPSYYEPWGYTPEECVASGGPSITSDLAGFGSYVQQTSGSDSKGLFIVGRRDASWEQSAHQLTEFCSTSAGGPAFAHRAAESGRAAVRYFDWGNLIVHYNEAHKLAMQRQGGPTSERLRNAGASSRRTVSGRITLDYETSHQWLRIPPPGKGMLCRRHYFLAGIHSLSPPSPSMPFVLSVFFGGLALGATWLYGLRCGIFSSAPSPPPGMAQSRHRRGARIYRVRCLGLVHFDLPMKWSLAWNKARLDALAEQVISR